MKKDKLSTVTTLVIFLTIINIGMAREKLSLDGVWQFKLDKCKTGESEKWFDDDVEFNNTINVPGSWEGQEFGEETGTIYHSHVGKGWFKREVLIPESWKDKNIYLCFGGVHRYSKVWVNGHYLGEHIGYLSEFEYDVSKFIECGEKALITVEVDSKQRHDEETLTGGMDLIDYMWVSWGGITGHVHLETRNERWLENIFVKPKTSPASCVVTAEIAGQKIMDDLIKIEIFDSKNNKVVEQKYKFQNIRNIDSGIKVELSIDNPKFWSPWNPDLYKAKFTLLNRDEKIVDSIETKFGLREIKIKGSDIYLNGKKIFLAGYGDDSCFPESIMPPTDKEFYLERLKTIKSYGFVYVRTHSTILPSEYYEACDEIGMFASAEFPIAYKQFYDRATERGLEIFRKSWKDSVKRLRNHPSIFNWCMGNELWFGVKHSQEFYDTMKELDPTRPAIDADGLYLAGILDGSSDRASIDFYTLMFDVWRHPLGYPEKFKITRLEKPIICHEMGNYVHFPRIDMIEEFDDTVKPYWLSPVKNKLKRLGLYDESKLWSEKSEQLYRLLHKVNIEESRKNPDIKGYHWWLFQDYWTTSNGIVDIYYRKKSIEPKDIIPFNGPLVLLQDGFQYKGYKFDDILDVKLMVSNFLPNELYNSQLSWSVKKFGKTIKKDKKNIDIISQGKLDTVDKITVKLPKDDKPYQLKLEVQLKSNGKKYSNHWASWVFPDEIKVGKQNKNIYISSELKNSSFLKPYQTEIIPQGSSLDSDAVYIMHQPSMEVFKALNEGAVVVLLTPQKIFENHCVRYKQAWWNGVVNLDKSAGTVVYPGNFVNYVSLAGWCPPVMHDLIDAAQETILDDFPSETDVMVRNLEVHFIVDDNLSGGAEERLKKFKDEVPYSFIFRNAALLWQAKVGKGTLICSGFNFKEASQKSPQVLKWFAIKLLEYALDAPEPKRNLDTKFVQESFKKGKLLDGTLVGGFSQLIEHKGKMREEWRNAKYADYGNICKNMRTCMTNDKNEFIKWKTDVIPDDSASRVIFVFEGGLCRNEGKPENGSFELYIDDKKIITFDAVQHRYSWNCNVNNALLLYMPLRGFWSDTTGLFYLSVPKVMVEPVSKATITVQANDNKKEFWFGLEPETGIFNY